jgi:PilZ domain
MALWRGGSIVDVRRSYSRTDLHEPAYISSAGASWSCTVVNLSEEGAAIELPDPTLVPARFVLMIARDRRTFACRFAWMKQNRIGVSFELPVAAEANAPLQADAAAE